MPIVLVSANSQNNKLNELVELVDKFDAVFLANTIECVDLVDQISEKIQCDHTFFLEELKPYLNDSNEDVRTKFNTIVNRFSSMKSGNILIVSYHDFFNKIKPDLVNEEWGVMSL